MAKARTKRRTHNKGDQNAAKAASDRTPKSMVIRIGAGEVGSSVSQLVKDMRQVMEPNTAARLKVRRFHNYTFLLLPSIYLESRANSRLFFSLL